MIPKIIHRIWFGTNPIPPQYDAWWEGWKRQLPSYEFISWTDANIDQLATAPQIYQADSMAKRADIARYEIMYRYGGTYLDCDFMPLNYYDFAKDLADLVICNESTVDMMNCSNGCFSIKQGHPLMKFAVELVCAGDKSASEVIGSTGPGFFGNLIRLSPFRRLPTISLYPYLFNEPFAAVYTRDLSKTYGIHVWHNSWFPSELKIRKINSMILNGAPIEVERLWNELGPTLQAEVPHALDVVERLREARRQIMGLCLSSILGSQVSRAPRPEFELLKTGLFLMGRKPEARIWQIGAADGVTDDPLRAIMVNFDPKALLVEPNPHLYAELLQNYAHNRNCRFLNAAVGAESGRGNLFSVNPRLVAAHELEEKTKTLSSLHCDGRSALGNACYNEFRKHALLPCLELVNVPIVNFDEVRAIADGELPDVLVINIGGGDDVLVMDALARGLSPTILMFGSEFMEEGTKETVCAALSASYEIFYFGTYHMAFQRSFLVEYCSEMFVEHGLSTMFEKPLSVIAGLRSADGAP